MTSKWDVKIVTQWCLLLYVMVCDTNTQSFPMLFMESKTIFNCLSHGMIPSSRPIFDLFHVKVNETLFKNSFHKIWVAVITVGCPQGENFII